MPVDLNGCSRQVLRCTRCGYWFLDPAIPEAVLLECYSKADATIWPGSDRISHVRSFASKAALLAQHSQGRRVLDVGCYDGAFLGALGPDWEKFGLEPSVKAAELARRSGASIIGRSVRDLPAAGEPAFDAIVLLDVMEHVTAPVDLLLALGRVLSAKGAIMIETGDTDSESFQRHRRLHSYCSYVEHVGFFNRTSLQHAAERSGLSIVSFQRTYHRVKSIGENFQHAVWNFGFSCLRQANRCGLPLTPRWRALASGPRPRSGSQPDHLLAVLRKD